MGRAYLCDSVEAVRPAPALLRTWTERSFDAPAASELRARPPVSTDLDVAVVGGGLIGGGLAAYLRTAFRREVRVALFDPGDALFEQFASRARALRQQTMRSGFFHQLAPDGVIQLLDFAKLHLKNLTRSERRQVEIAVSGQRALVPTDLFLAHARHVAAVLRLPERTFRTRVASLRRARRGWELRTATGHRVRARAVVLAPGCRPRSPLAPGPAAAGEGARLEDLCSPCSPRAVAVIGGGMSGAHCVMRLAAAAHRVVWILRREPTFACNDYHHSHFRTEGLAEFERLDPAERARHLGRVFRATLMPEFRTLTDELVAARQLRIRIGTVTSVRGERILFADGSQERADAVIAAYGYAPVTDLLPDGLRSANGLPVIDDSTLEVRGAPRLYAAGPLACSAIGPAARNIDGARLAAARVMPALAQTVLARFEYSGLGDSGFEPIGRVH